MGSVTARTRRSRVMSWFPVIADKPACWLRVGDCIEDGA
jgi:hypothetical protein